MFLHEGLGSVALWREFPERLAPATGRRALVYSRAGHGQSDLPDADRTPRFMHEEALDVLPGCSGRAASSGRCSSATATAARSRSSTRARHPVSGLVLLAPHVFVEDITVASIEEARETFATTDLGARMARYHRDPERTFRLWNDIWLAPEFRAWNIEDVLARRDGADAADPGRARPVRDAGADRRDRARHRRGGVARVVLDARHAPHLEAPEETLAGGRGVPATERSRRRTSSSRPRPLRRAPTARSS